MVNSGFLYRVLWRESIFFFAHGQRIIESAVHLHELPISWILNARIYVCISSCDMERPLSLVLPLCPKKVALRQYCTKSFEYGLYMLSIKRKSSPRKFVQ